MFARAPFALDEAAGDLARGVHALFVLDREREKVNAFARVDRGNGGRQQDGVAISDEDGTVSQTGHAASFEGQRAPGDFSI